MLSNKKTRFRVAEEIFCMGIFHFDIVLHKSVTDQSQSQSNIRHLAKSDSGVVAA